MLINSNIDIKISTQDAFLEWGKLKAK